MNLEIIKQKAVPVLKRHGVVKASVFGSYARGVQTDKSDIDFIIDYAPGIKKTLFDLVDLKEELEITLNKNIDLITGSTKLSSYIKDMIMREKQVII